MVDRGGANNGHPSFERPSPDRQSLIGRIPIFLQALAGIKVREPVPGQLDDDERWEQLLERFYETEPAATMRQRIAEFYSQTRRQLETTHSGSWKS